MLLLLFFTSDLYLLIATVIAKTFILAAKLVIPTRVVANEANEEIETQP